MNVLIALQERVKGCWMFISKYFARFVISKRMLLSGSEMEKKNLINLHCEVISIVVKVFFFFFFSLFLMPRNFLSYEFLHLYCFAP